MDIYELVIAEEEYLGSKSDISEEGYSFSISLISSHSAPIGGPH